MKVNLRKSYNPNNISNSDFKPDNTSQNLSMNMMKLWKNFKAMVAYKKALKGIKT